MPVQELRKRPTVELLELDHGADAFSVLDKYDGSVAKMLRNSTVAYAPGTTILQSARALVTRALHEELGAVNCLGRPQKVRE